MKYNIAIDIHILLLKMKKKNHHFCYLILVYHPANFFLCSRANYIGLVILDISEIRIIRGDFRVDNRCTISDRGILKR